MRIGNLHRIRAVLGGYRKWERAMSVSSAIRKAAKGRPSGPVWKGPCEDGVTQSLLSRYLSCKERFRILTIEGLKPAERFNPALDFGNMWHSCEETFAAVGKSVLVSDVLGTYESELGRKFPLQRQEIAEWAGKCAALFPRYVTHWGQHPDVKDRTPLLQEAAFNVPYALPSGRTVKLRGKFDSVDLIGKGKGAGIYLQENKTKGSIDGSKINRQLSFDLQTMLYLVALLETDLAAILEPMGYGQMPVLGVRYNVIRRAAHKTVGSMLEKFEKDKKEGRIGEWFARWRVEVSAADITKFKRECLDPVLENLCDDYEWWRKCKELGKSPFNDDLPRSVHPLHHFRMPYCGYNPLSEGGFGDVDEYMATGSTVGLARVDNLFPELE